MGVAIFEASISHLTPYMDGHRVGDVPLCPASVFIELVAAGITLALKYLSRYPLDSALVFTDFTFTKPITTNSRRDQSSGKLANQCGYYGWCFLNYFLWKFLHLMTK
jgi:hypothetical protein